jgi:glutaminase
MAEPQKAQPEKPSATDDITKRERRLFFALDDDADGLISEKSLIDALRTAGLDDRDKRLASVYSRLSENGGEPLTLERFSRVVSTSVLLVEQALQGRLVIPYFEDFSEHVDQIYDEVLLNDRGQQADYIPPLAAVDPDQFGLAIVTVDGQTYVKGDYEVDFSLQSICKTFDYCLALEEHGSEEVHRHVGKEPSGRAFNDRDLMERLFAVKADGKPVKIEIPFNPMINAGAIMTASLIKSATPFKERLRYVREMIGNMVGSASDELPRFNKEMARNENYTGYNNVALGYLLMATGMLPHGQSTLPEDGHPDEASDYSFFFEPAVERAMQFYFGTCSIEMNVREVATAAATMANGGTCPITRERVLQQATVRDCLSVTQMCGMYDESGDFFFSIGLPAKSGVGGGLMLVVPNLMGVCIFSPRLDRTGNSVRGVAVARKLVSEYSLHIHDSVMTADSDRMDPRVPNARWRATHCADALWAASNGDIRTLEYLMSVGYDLELGDYDKRTPMHLASAEGHPDVVEFLLDKGISPKPDRWGGYPASDALENAHSSIVELFKREQLPDSQPYHSVSNEESPSITGVSYADGLAVAELLWAAAENDMISLRRLVAQGVPVHAMDYDRRTGLHLAAAEGRLAAVKYLVAHGHPLHARDRWKATPLDEAIREQRGEVIEYLIEAEAAEQQAAEDAAEDA